MLRCLVALAVAVYAAPNNVSKSAVDEREFVNATVTGREFSCWVKCPQVVACACRNCLKNVCVFDSVECSRWCACSCENEKRYGGS